MLRNAQQYAFLAGGLFSLASAVACAPAASAGDAKSPEDHDHELAEEGDAEGDANAQEAPREDVVVQAARPFSGYRPTDDKKFDEEALITFLASADAVCVGERHDEPLDHYAQLRVVEGFAQRRALRGFELGVGLEMVRQADQPALDAYLEGRLDDEDFEKASNWKGEWGFPIQYYRPTLQVARNERAGLVALGVARPLTRAVAEKGIDSLPEEKKRQVPELNRKSDEHRELFESLMQGHPMPHGKVDNYYEAQLIWDEKMAEEASHWLVARQPGRKLVILAGTAHCHRTAIPARLQRRTGLTVVSVIPVDDGAPRPLVERPTSAEEKMLAGYDYQMVFGQ
jgi:uncharacterized iron-regulated protein